MTHISSAASGIPWYKTTDREPVAFILNKDEYQFLDACKQHILDLNVVMCTTAHKCRPFYLSFNPRKEIELLNLSCSHKITFFMYLACKNKVDIDHLKKPFKKVNSPFRGNAP